MVTEKTISLDDVDFRLKALDSDLVEAWELEFDGYVRVSASQGDILRETADAIVSPANSFGFMDGGLDLQLSQHFGWHLETRVREVLLRDYDGELPVGQAVIVPTDHPGVPWLISAPTMRVPMRVDGTANAHLAFRAILRAVRQHNRESDHQPIRSVLCPGLGTGEGRMPATRCARQMRHAYRVCVHGEVLRKGGLAAAVEQHIELLGE